MRSTDAFQSRYTRVTAKGKSKTTTHLLSSALSSYDATPLVVISLTKTLFSLLSTLQWLSYHTIDMLSWLCYMASFQFPTIGIHQLGGPRLWYPSILYVRDCITPCLRNCFKWARVAKKSVLGEAQGFCRQSSCHIIMFLGTGTTIHHIKTILQLWEITKQLK